MNLTRIRIAILLFLLAFTLLYQGLQIYEMMFHPLIRFAGTAGYEAEVRNGVLEITRIRAKDENGKATPAAQAGLKKSDRIIAIVDPDGRRFDITSMGAFYDAQRSLHIGNPYRMVINRPVSGEQEKTLTIDMPPINTSSFGFRDHLLTILAGVVLPFITIVTAFFIGFGKPSDGRAFLATLMFLGFSSMFAASYGLFPPVLREVGAVYHGILSNFALFLFMMFFLRFPSPSVIERRIPWLKWVFLVVTSFLVALSIVVGLSRMTSFARFERLRDLVKPLAPLEIGFLLGALGIGLASLVLNTVKAHTRDERRRLIIILSGTLMAFLPLIILFVVVSLTRAEPPLWILVVIIAAMGLFPLSFFYAVVKHRVLGIRLIIRRGLRYAMVSRGFLAIEVVIIFLVFFFAAGPLFLRIFPGVGPAPVALTTAAFTLIIALLLRKFNQRVMPIIDRRFFRDAYSAQQILSDLSRAVRRLSYRTDQLLQLVVDKISDSLYPDHVAIFLRGAELIRAHPGSPGAGGTLVRFNDQDFHSFRCYRHRMRYGHKEERLYSHTMFERLSLPEDTLTAHQLQTVVDTPRTIDVYPDDPESWAHDLNTNGEHTEARNLERAFLGMLNTRLLLPLISNDQLVGFISLGEKLSEEPYTGEDKDLLMTVADQTAIALDFSQLIHQVAEQEKFQREMEIAREVQERLFPQSLPAIKSLEYTGICRSARGVGGDYYDFIQIGPDTLGIALGDISGKGISAALLMASLQAFLRSQAHLSGENLEDLVRRINRLMCDSTVSSRYATFFYGIYRESNHTFTYVNAGHNPPLLFRARSNGNGGAPGHPDPAPHPVRPETLGPQSTRRLETGGLPVGMFPDSTYHKETIKLHPDDLMVIYSDGISEAMNSRGEQYGEENLARCVSDHRDLPVESLRDRILEDITRFARDTEQHDDMTLVVVRVH